MSTIVLNNTNTDTSAFSCVKCNNAADALTFGTCGEAKLSGFAVGSNCLDENAIYINKAWFKNFRVPGSFKCFTDDKRGNYKVNEVFIKEVLYTKPATVVFWSDNTKTTCKVDDMDIYNPEFGLILCVLKKLAGNDAAVKLIDYWAPTNVERLDMLNGKFIRKTMSQIRTKFNKTLKKIRKK